MKLNLELTEKKMGGMIPQAKEPKSAVGKAPWTKGSKFEPKAPKFGKHKVNKQDYKDPTKFARKGSPLKVGDVQPGKAEKAPGSKELGPKQPVVSKGREVKAPAAPKVAKSRAAVPDAGDVTKRGLTGNDAGEATADFCTKVQKAVEPSKSAKNITIAKAKIVKPDLGYGVLKPGKVMDVLGNTKVDMEKVAKPPAPKSYPGKSPIPSKPVSESVFNGAIEIRAAGRTKAVLEAATPSAVARRALDYASIGARVEIVPVVRGRTLYSDREFAALMVEAEHVRHHGMPDRELRAAAFRRARDLLEPERDPRVHSTAQEWLRECLIPTLKQASREYKAAYRAALEPHDVTVVSEGRRTAMPVMAADEQHAAAIAVDAVLSEDISTSIKSIYVGGRKFLPEGSGGRGLFMRFPKPFSELSGGQLFKKSPSGERSEPKLGRVPELKVGSSQRPKGVPALAIKANTRFEGGGERGSLVDRNGSRSKPGKALSMDDTPKDTGPVYERRRFVEDASQRVLDMIDQAAKRASGDDRKMLEELHEKLRNDDDLTDKETAVVNRVIGIVVGK